MPCFIRISRLLMEKKNTNSSLTKSSLVYAIGNIGTLGINFFLVPLYTFYLSKDELGLFDTIASSLLVLTPFFFGHIELAILRWVIADKGLENVKKVISNSFFIFCLGSLVFSLLYLVLNQFFFESLTQYIFIYLVANFFYVITKQVLRSVYSPLHYVLTEVLYTLIVLGFILFFISEMKLNAIFLSYGIASSLLLLYILILGIAKKIELKMISFPFLRELLGYAVPSIPNTFSLWLNNMSNKYLIVFFIGFGANGIYAIAFKFAYVIQILNKIFYFSFQDKMYQLHGTDKYSSFFRETFRSYSKVLFSILYGLIVTQGLLLPFIIDEKFLDAIYYIPILGTGVLFFSLASIVGVIYQCEKKNIHASKTSAASGIFILVLGYFLIPAFGLYAASIVFMIGNLGLFLYRYYDTQKYISRKPLVLHFVGYILIGFLLWRISLMTIGYLNLVALPLAIGIGAGLNWKLIASKTPVFLNVFKGLAQRITKKRK